MWVKNRKAFFQLTTKGKNNVFIDAEEREKKNVLNV